MTCREKLKMEHPEYIDGRLLGGCRGCPNDYGYLPDPEAGCFDARCAQCWDREIPGTDVDTDTLRKLVNSANEMTLTMKKMTEAMEYLTIITKELYMKLEIEKGKLEHGRAADT